MFERDLLIASKMEIPTWRFGSKPADTANLYPSSRGAAAPFLTTGSHTASLLGALQIHTTPTTLRTFFQGPLTSVSVSSNDQRSKWAKSEGVKQVLGDTCRTGLTSNPDSRSWNRTHTRSLGAHPMSYSRNEMERFLWRWEGRGFSWKWKAGTTCSSGKEDP